MSVAKKILDSIERSSWIRKMFEEGNRLKSLYGCNNVSDFSLGNPNVQPPEIVEKTLTSLTSQPSEGFHAYMPNSGYEDTRSAVASYLEKVLATELQARHVVMTCGAAGGLNIILKAILNAFEEVICPAPYFVEYNFYCDNHAGKLVPVATREDFSLDVGKIEAAITPETRAVLINSPNNPTGQVYGQSDLQSLGDLLRNKSRTTGKKIYLISDEPYRDIVYDNITVPSIFSVYDDSIITNSYSKSISIPGERIGYVVVNPKTQGVDNLLEGLILANRILGFVNAPALMQRLVAHVQGVSVDAGIYKRKRDRLCKILQECGYEFTLPAGAFYVFPKSPIPDDVSFVRILQEELILAVPGSGFGGPGHFRLAYCVDDHTINRSAEGFKKAREKALEVTS